MAIDRDFLTLQFSDLPKECFGSDVARQICGAITVPERTGKELKNIRLDIHCCSEPERLAGIEIHLASIPSFLSVALSNPEQKLRLGRGCRGHWTFRLWGACSAVIGDNATSNGVECFLNEGGSLTIGDDCVFASNTSLHVGDNHSIFDFESGKGLHYSERPYIDIGAHVRVSRRGVVLADTVIGAGGVISTGSVVKGIFPSYSLIAGAPAKALLKERVSWARDYRSRRAKEQVIEKLGAEG